MSNASKTAFGGIMVALGVVIMLPTALEIFVYALPLFAGLIIVLCVVELGKKWAFSVYAATSVIGFIVVPNKEAVLMYIAFFGYYPILKAILESKVPKYLEIILKFLVFNVSVCLATALMIKFLGVPFEQFMGFEQSSALSKFALPIMLILGNVTFVVYDFFVSNFVSVYTLKWRKRIKSIFRFK